MATFKDVSTSRRSEVWDYFNFSQDLQQAKCKMCKVLLKTPGSTTTVFKCLVMVQQYHYKTLKNET